MATQRERPRRAVTEVSAGGVVYRRTGGDILVLLIRDGYGHWGLPKGHIEPGETPELAALREVEEETGLDGLRLSSSLPTIDWFFRSEAGLIHKFCHFFLIESPEGEAVPRAEEGITECRWLPLERAIEQISYRNAREVLSAAASELSSSPKTTMDPESDG